MGAFDLVGTTASGWLSDRYSSRWLLFWYYGLRGLSLLFLPIAFGVGVLGLPIFAMFYGLDWIATVPPTVKLAAATLRARARAAVLRLDRGGAPARRRDHGVLRRRGPQRRSAATTTRSSRPGCCA